MNVAKSLWASIESDPVFMRRIHGWLTIIWFLASFPIMFFWSENIQFLVFVSVYAVVTGHWSSWQASRVEVQQQIDAETREGESNGSGNQEAVSEGNLGVRDSAATG